MNEELLTKGTKKERRQGLHRVKIARTCQDTDLIPLTLHGSYDAKTWCQRMIISQLGIMVISMVPRQFRGFFYNIFNLFVNKKLRMPDGLINLFMKYPGVKDKNKGIEKASKEFNNLEERFLLCSRRKLIKNRTNMQQGILHYTSSIFHVCMKRGLADLMVLIMDSSFRTAKFAGTDISPGFVFHE